MLNISFMTGTRADYSKIKPFIEYFLSKRYLKVHIFVTGMHLYKKYGETVRMIYADFGQNCAIVKDKRRKYSDSAERMADVIKSYNHHLLNDNIDYVFVHGDRPDALAAALAASFHNIPICHIEAGDLSGSIDEGLRHAISKLAHTFLVTDKNAQKILQRMGEDKNNIHIVGNSSLANCDNEINAGFKQPFDEYGVLIYHPVTTLNENDIAVEIKCIMQSLAESELNYVVILPNNDRYNEVIFEEYSRYEKHPAFKFYKSLSFDTFTNLLKKARFLIGNSSCGIKEAPFYGVPVIDIGIRQQNRCPKLKNHLFMHIESAEDIVDALKRIAPAKNTFCHQKYRQKLFNKLDEIVTEKFWHPQIQKEFHM